MHKRTISVSEQYGFHYICFLGLLMLLWGGTSFRATGMEAVVTQKVFFVPLHMQRFDPYIEVYWDINPQSVQFQNEKGLYKAKIKTTLTITADTGSVFAEQYILETTPLADASQTHTKRITDLRRLQIPEGTFLLRVRFEDLSNDKNTYTYEDTVNVYKPAAAAFLGDIQILDTFFVSGTPSVYQRNGFIQIPLPSTFLDSRRKLHFYNEVYLKNAGADPYDVKFPLISKVFISRKEGDLPHHQILRTDTISKGPVAVLLGTLDIATLSSGNYYLNMIIQDAAQQQLDRKQLFLQVMNANPETFRRVEDTSTALPTILDLSKTFVSRYTAPQIRAILKMLIPIANQAEKPRIYEFLRNMDDMYARYFIYNFWMNRNNKEPEKEWKAYAEKIKEVNKLFGSANTPGYEGDRGMIYIKYGKPTERLIVNNEQGTQPYELWLYNTIPGASGVAFLFYRPAISLSGYELLHSTVTWEKRTLNWRNFLYINGVPMSRMDSKAEEYIGNR